MTWEQTSALIVTILVAAFWQNQRFGDMHKRIDTLEAQFGRHIDALRGEMNAGFTTLRGEMQTLREEMRAGFADLKAELRRSRV